MKNKFEDIVRIKKQELNKVENNFNKAKQRQIQNEELYALARKEYENLCVLPNSGSIAQLKSSLSMAAVAKDALKIAKERVELSKKEINHYRFLYKRALLDYEKVKALELEEIQRKQKEYNKMQEKFLDELAIIGFLKGEKDV